jgi:hypothetical protein
VVLGSIVLWFCTGRRVLLGEVGVKCGMSVLEQVRDGFRGGAECVGTLGLTTREEVILATISPSAAKLVKEA